MKKGDRIVLTIKESKVRSLKSNEAGVREIGELLFFKYHRSEVDSIGTYLPCSLEILPAEEWLTKADIDALKAEVDMLREGLGAIVGYIDKEGPPAREWEAISEWCDKARALLEGKNG